MTRPIRTSAPRSPIVTEAKMQTQLEGWRARADQALTAALPDTALAPQNLHKAMHHAVLLGGKRMRPLLVYAAAYAIASDEFDTESCDAAAAAVELVHAYSLVHDDLPCMDDDALRRGQPTVHVAFDEATAVLTGDALQTLAFETLAKAAWPATTTVETLRILATASGANGMCGGQALDMDATGQRIGLDALKRLHALKTGALIHAAVELGAVVAGATSEQREALSRYSTALGLAFQIQDDILDVEGDASTLGKTAGKDAAQDKSTFVSVLGLQASKDQLQLLLAEMEKALAPFGTNALPLRALADLAVRRTH